MAQSSHLGGLEIRKADAFVLRTIPPPPKEKAKSRAQRDREAKAYWDSLTLEKEAWALRKMGFFRTGQPNSAWKATAPVLKTGDGVR